MSSPPGGGDNWEQGTGRREHGTNVREQVIGRGERGTERLGTWGKLREEGREYETEEREYGTAS